MDMPDIALALGKQLLIFAPMRCSGGSRRLLRPGLSTIRLRFLCPRLVCLFRLQILLIRLLVCNQAGLLFVQLPLWKKSVTDHLPQILLYKFRLLADGR